MLLEVETSNSGALYPGVPTDWVSPDGVEKQAIP